MEVNNITFRWELFAHRARLTPINCKNKYLVLALEEETAVGNSSWLYRLSVSLAQKAEESGDERPRLRAS